MADIKNEFSKARALRNLMRAHWQIIEKYKRLMESRPSDMVIVLINMSDAMAAKFEGQLQRLFGDGAADLFSLGSDRSMAPLVVGLGDRVAVQTTLDEIAPEAACTLEAAVGSVAFVVIDLDSVAVFFGSNDA